VVVRIESATRVTGAGFSQRFVGALFARDFSLRARSANALRVRCDVGLLDRELVVVELAQKARRLVLLLAVPFPPRARRVRYDLARRIVFQRANPLAVTRHSEGSRPKMRASLAKKNEPGLLGRALQGASRSPDRGGNPQAGKSIDPASEIGGQEVSSLWPRSLHCKLATLMTRPPGRSSPAS